MKAPPQARPVFPSLRQVSMRAVPQKIVPQREGRMALLDSGSTNNLRPGSLAEVKTGIVIDVALADGTSKFVQLPSGTLMC